MLFQFQADHVNLASIPAETLDMDAAFTHYQDKVRVDQKSQTYLVKTFLSENPNLEEMLFTNRADLKTLLSRVAMHIPDTARIDIFKQIDEILDLDSFGECDRLVEPRSFSTFLRFFTFVSKVKRIAFTVSVSGNIAGTWISPTGKLHIEFMPDNMYRASVSRKTEDDVEYYVYRGRLKQLITFLERNDFTGWFLNV